MARDAQSADDAGHTPRSEEKQGRRPSRTERDERRRLSEREQVSGEIRTPAHIAARRARRVDRPDRPSAGASRRSPVSASAAVPERTLSGRAIVLTIVALVVVSFLVPTVRTYFQQQSELEELSVQIRAEQQEQADLYAELARWEDPEFVTQQARERLNLVQPGDRRYHVMNASADEPVEEEAQEEQSESWAERLWDGILADADE
ncbi:septum formation initiator family protein [Nesterenkonia sp. NBAIMH1]|uniref:FtsB family cell division protein n=1 Tax=Nesterenkonia sp. NBAIMH1 TaxID=2600320 RepID=UPI0011B55D93|nr:septum formation initiator family protein [Nesterenkonia sp. NBAIMH1]